MDGLLQAPEEADSIQQPIPGAGDDAIVALKGRPVVGAVGFGRHEQPRRLQAPHGGRHRGRLAVRPGVELLGQGGTPDEGRKEGGRRGRGVRRHGR